MLYVSIPNALNLFDDLFNTEFPLLSTSCLNTRDTESGTELEINLAGFKKEDVKLTLESNGRLRVKANSGKKTTEKLVYVGKQVEVASATMENGLLKVTLKEKEQEKKTIEIT